MEGMQILCWFDSNQRHFYFYQNTYKGFQLQLLSRDERFKKNAHLLTAENVLIWLSDDKARPGFASIIINTEGGPAWLERQIEALKSGAFSPIEVIQDVT